MTAYGSITYALQAPEDFDDSSLEGWMQRSELVSLHPAHRFLDGNSTKGSALELRLAVLPLLVSIYWLFVGDFALGQSGTSFIHGSVMDPQGNLLAGVSVTLKGSERDFLRSQTSNEKGMYIFSGVPPGTYLIEAEM